MMIPEFMRFYRYTATDALQELARVFFSLMNSMYRLKAQESLNAITNASAAFSGGPEGDKVVHELLKQNKGIPGILDEVRSIKK